MKKFDVTITIDEDSHLLSFLINRDKSNSVEDLLNLIGALTLLQDSIKNQLKKTMEVTQ